MEHVAEDGDRIIGTAEAAELLNVDQRTIQRKVHTGQIPIVGKVGTRYLIRESDVRHIVEETEAP